jgi:hypothetical protein
MDEPEELITMTLILQKCSTNLFSPQTEPKQLNPEHLKPLTHSAASDQFCTMTRK